MNAGNFQVLLKIIFQPSKEKGNKKNAQKEKLTFIILIKQTKIKYLEIIALMVIKC